MVSAFGIFLLRQYYQASCASTMPPRSTARAGLASGGGSSCHRPALLATLGIFAFMFAWNDFLWPLVVVNDPDMRTVQLGLAMFQGRYGTQWTLLMAGTVTATLPTLLIFLIGQRWFIQSVAQSGVKG